MSMGGTPGTVHPFEEQVHLDHTSFIDGAIPSTNVLIEQKGLGKDLNKPIKQSEGHDADAVPTGKAVISQNCLFPSIRVGW